MNGSEKDYVGTLMAYNLLKGAEEYWAKIYEAISLTRDLTDVSCADTLQDLADTADKLDDLMDEIIYRCREELK